MEQLVTSVREINWNDLIEIEVAVSVQTKFVFFNTDFLLQEVFQILPIPSWISGGTLNDLLVSWPTELLSQKVIPGWAHLPVTSP